MKRVVEPGMDARGMGMLAILLPIAVAQLSRVLDGMTPASAAASSMTPALAPPAFPQAPPTELTPPQRRALEWLQGREHVSVLSDPFASAESTRPIKPTPAAPEAATPPPTIPAPAPTPPELKISGFMGKGDAAMVTVNKRVHRLGDEVAPGWTLVAVQPIERSIRVQHTDGTTVQVSANARGEK